MQARFALYTFLGYVPNHKSYLCSHIESMKVITNRHVFCNKTEFPFTKCLFAICFSSNSNSESQSIICALSWLTITLSCSPSQPLSTSSFDTQYMTIVSISSEFLYLFFMMCLIHLFNQLVHQLLLYHLVPLIIQMCLLHLFPFLHILVILISLIIILIQNLLPHLHLLICPQYQKYVSRLLFL